MNDRVDREKIYNSSNSFFELNGSAIMKLDPPSAIEVCKRAIEERMHICRIEGGFWHFPGFEARYDCIWDSIYRTIDMTKEDILQNSFDAQLFIREKMKEHNVFIITICGQVTS